MVNATNDSDDLPDAPDDLPSYVEDTLKEWNGDAAVLAAISDYADALRSHAADEPTLAEDADGEIVEVHDVSGTLVSKLQQCGDDSCRCASGDEADLHGPYLWDVYRNDAGEREWEYVGKAVDDENASA